MASQTIQLMFLSNECDVEFDYSPFVPGRMYMRNGDPGYPDEPEEFIITSITAHYDNKQTIDLLPLLSEQALEDAEEAIKEIWDNEHEPVFADDRDWDQAA